MDFTPLFDKSGTPLMPMMSLEYLLVSLPVFRFTPVNWIVAPRIESMTDPTRPAPKPVNAHLE